MSQTYFNLVVKYAFLAIEIQQVVALRMMRIAAGGALADRELQRLISEKAWAHSQIGFNAALAFASGRSGAAIMHGAVRGYRAHVRNNRRRLTISKIG